jgi:putative ABC transport system permease protein
VIVGVVVGLGGALAAGHLVAAQLYRVSPRDPATLALAAAVLLAAALTACLLPARRATRVDPLIALRND